jgi:single-stranded-DNA-specific exonuclease
VPNSQQTKWIVNAASAEADDLGQKLPRIIRVLLHQRGIRCAESAEAFLNPKLNNLADPFLLPDMREAVDRILLAVDNKEKIVIYGDYDVDGVTSITLLKTTLKAYGIDAGTFLPHRMDEGYGISFDGIERCLDEFQPSLFIGVDCGTTSIKEVERLKELGIDVIICDHHEENPEGRPPTVALVNPKLGDCFHYLCTVGVIFKVAHALLKTRPLEHFVLRDYLDIVAVGTIADIVPLEDENRALVRRGLHELSETRNLGLAALREVAQLSPPFSSMDIGFRIGPRLNAAGRLDTAQAALDLLLADTPVQAKAIAEGLDQQNRERQVVELRIRNEAEEQARQMFQGEVPPPGIVLASDDWHPGVVGIVASRISRKYCRPTFIVAIDEEGIGKGSGRSVEDISLVELINDTRPLLLKGGGHAMAAGISIRKENIDEFREAFCAAIVARAGDEALIPKLKIDLEVGLGELDFDLLRAYYLMEPFGASNPLPIFIAKGVQLAAEPREHKGKHYSFRLLQGDTIRDAIYFGGMETELPKLPWDVAFQIQRNVYRGRISIQLIVQSIRTCE